MDDVISIIVPVYNVEEYLGRCIRSIVNQTYGNLEILLVDDGSKDNSGSLCDEWEKKDPRIKVIHKSNGGLADARNAGLKIATGNYIGFIDSDDWVDIDMYQILHREAKKFDLDIIESDIHWLCPGDESGDSGYREGETRTEIYSIPRAMELLVEEKILRQTVWNKLYRKEVLADIFFEKGKLHEDEFWTYRVFGKAGRIGHINAKFYYYFLRPNSIMGNTFTLRRLDTLEGRYRRWQYIKEKFPNAEKGARKNVYFSCMLNYQWSLDYLNENDFARAREIINHYLAEILKEKSLFSLRGKELFWYPLSRVSFHGAARLKNVFRKGR